MQRSAGFCLSWLALHRARVELSGALRLLVFWWSLPSQADQLKIAEDALLRLAQRESACAGAAQSSWLISQLFPAPCPGEKLFCSFSSLLCVFFVSGGTWLELKLNSSLLKWQKRGNLFWRWLLSMAFTNIRV